MQAKKYFFVISYNGQGYSGWQSQKNGSGIQEAVEHALSVVLKGNIKAHGCGRTDTGVHADNYVFHAFFHEPKPDLLFKLNRKLPSQIAVKGIYEVPQRANAQLDAIKRIYTYYVHFDKDPYLNTFSWWYNRGDVDHVVLKKACSLVEGERDFANFCLSLNKHDYTTCKMKSVEVFKNPAKNQIAIRFTADRYLRSMIRLLVGSILEVAAGNISLMDFEEQLNMLKPKKKNHKAAPQGLHLTGVKYPFFKTDIPNPF